ncbi:hypothetical protein [Streptomyces sp. ME19-01-6]|uniref:hypothetical protein n=1 Tax=Streptomyces sp. ME19-01-6 TaxID=3028686 RepID=UPI0029BD3BB2|nr:hypothetical protein [Streptomyces sp. ME19-01-6]MDX3233322.1 hypothetical protein [Streptomyces sp. ME19-01-6]
MTARGFRGFVPFRELPGSNVPTGHGIYVVIRTDTSPPSFLPTSPAGHLKGRDPSVTADTSDALLVAWRPRTEDDPGEAEQDLIDELKELHGGALPFANLRNNARKTPEADASLNSSRSPCTAQRPRPLGGTGRRA